MRESIFFFKGQLNQARPSQIGFVKIDFVLQYIGFSNFAKRSYLSAILLILRVTLSAVQKVKLFILARHLGILVSTLLHFIRTKQFKNFSPGERGRERQREREREGLFEHTREEICCAQFN